MTPGTRIRLVVSPWPERQGMTGTVLAPPSDGTYPQPARWESLIAIDDDPLNGSWCVVATRSLEEIR